ncbi:hypothetical protein B0T10DRAFT_531386 [Thelonectria olida]|uniref:Uncharacterized protein n=1 Tax=Thelonectria olida TaxID=1576542 RepID=A0A9P9AM26_9HYPO|nr:hypothetical protein B0T10DRAFT_531386 [Thelonectria olida]
MDALTIDNAETKSQKLHDSLPPPTKSLQIYSRLAFGRKFLFAPSGNEEGQYFVINPVPHKHHYSWKPVFYRGDNPKYTPASKAIARMRRTKMWNSFRIQFGDGVGEALDNKKKVKKTRHYQRRQKWRKRFGRKEKPPKEELEDPTDVQGLLVEFKMKRRAFINRTVKWEFAGEQYRWTGTRAFLSNRFRRWKGVSHDLKLVNSNNDIIATIQKDRWSSFRRSERTDAPPNKKKSLVGTLRIYPAAYTDATLQKLQSLNIGSHSTVSANADEVDGKQWNMGGDNGKQTLNEGGEHSGDVIEEAIVLTAWIVLEAEHRLRYKVLDVLEEIAEEFKE